MSRRLKKSPIFLEDIGPLGLDAADPLGRGLFLGLFDADQIAGLLEVVGLLERVRLRGYGPLEVVVARQEDVSRFYLGCRSSGCRLIELIVRETSFRPRQSFVSGFEFAEGLSALEVQWLSLQDPRASFSSVRPRLPGQTCQGLGGLRQMHELLLRLAGARDAVVNVPERYHTAVIYAQEYHFFSPLAAGQLVALERDLGRWPLGAVSAAIEAGCLIDLVRDVREPWRPSEQMAALSGRLKAYFAAPAYREQVFKTAEALRYAVDWVQYERIKSGVDSNE